MVPTPLALFLGPAGRRLTITRDATLWQRSNAQGAGWQTTNATAAVDFTGAVPTMQFTATGTPASVVYEYVPVDAGAFYNYSVVLGGTAYHRITLTFYAVNGTTVTGTYVGPVSNASKPVRAIENPSTVPAGSAYARLSIELLTAAGSPAAVGATLTATDLLILSESSPVYASVSNYDRASAQRNLIPNPGIAELGASGWTTPFTGDSMSHDGTALTYSYLGGRARSPVQSRSASHRAGS